MKETDYIKNFDDLCGVFSVSYSDTEKAPKATFHIHDAFEITMILSENAEIDVNEESYPVPRGSLLLFNTMDLHRIRSTGADRYKRYVLWFKYEFLNELDALRGELLKCFYCRVYDKPNCLPLNRAQQEEMLQLFVKIDEAFHEQDKYGQDVLTKLRLGELLTAVNKLYLPRQAHQNPIVLHDHRSVYQVIQYIQEHFAEKLDQDFLARSVYTDKRTLCGSFQAITGMTTGQYIIQCRLTAAKALLVQGTPVSLVCEKTGFGDACNFSRTFRKHVGLSPKQYAVRHIRSSGE